MILKHWIRRLSEQEHVHRLYMFLLSSFNVKRMKSCVACCTIYSVLLFFFVCLAAFCAAGSGTNSFCLNKTLLSDDFPQSRFQCDLILLGIGLLNKAILNVMKLYYCNANEYRIFEAWIYAYFYVNLIHLEVTLISLSFRAWAKYTGFPSIEAGTKDYQSSIRS